MDTALVYKVFNDNFDSFILALMRSETYSQIGVIVLVYVIAYTLALKIRKFIPAFNTTPDAKVLSPIRNLLFYGSKLLYPIFAIMLLRFCLEFGEALIEDPWVINTAIVIAALLLFHSFINIFIRHTLIAMAFRWIGMPIIFFHSTGVLEDIIQVLDSIAIQIGNIKLSAYGVIRVIIFGSLLFWFGRVSNATGQTIIRKQESLELRTREVFAKVFEVILFFLIFVLLLQVMGINLTALAVFGGAVGVGLGFGLQAIASNFISGIIILLDRSVSVGDYIELEDGLTGTVTELNMRSTTMETYDGKDIVVPNEKFITTSFTNWTHKDNKQRYRVDFSVSYSTNIREMVEVIKGAVAKHPQVMSGEDLPIEERPDCEIDSFGDNGVNMFVEFWMRGIDDGKNRVGGDLLLEIFETLQAHDIEIPFPQRDIRIVEDRTK